MSINSDIDGFRQLQAMCMCMMGNHKSITIYVPADDNRSLSFPHIYSFSIQTGIHLVESFKAWQFPNLFCARAENLFNHKI